MIRIIALLMLTVLWTGCGFKEREAALKQKETVLQQKEQNLILRETELSLREADLLKRERTLDSIRLDTAFVYDSLIIGKWSVKMTCTETTCAGSALGDTKSEVWQFQYQDNQLTVRALEGEKLVRIYTGKSTGKGIELADSVAGVSSAPATKMLVQLQKTNAGSMKGERRIIRENDCSIVYGLELSKTNQP